MQNLKAQVYRLGFFLLQIAVKTASCPFAPRKLLTQLQNHFYPFAALPFLPFSLSFFLCPNLPKLQRVLRTVCGGVFG